MLVAPAWAMAAEGEVAQGGHDGGAVAGAALTVIFGEGHIADPVQFVLDRPTIADGLGELVERMSPKPRSGTA